MMRRMIVMTMLCVLATQPLWAEVRVHNAFGENMVLQRDKELKVWGWADKDEAVTVDFSGQSTQTKADNDGKWSVKIGPFKANSDPQVLTIKGAGNTITLKNILMGDVWLCGGQSNMEHELESIYHADMEVPCANYPNIRLMSVAQGAEDDPQEDIERMHQFKPWDRSVRKKAMWQICTPGTAAHYCGIGYLFGRRLHMFQQIPIGLVDTSRGGTTVETWTSDATLKSIPEAKDLLAKFAKRRAEIEKRFNAENELKERIRVWTYEIKERKKLNLPDLPQPSVLRTESKPDRSVPSASYNAMMEPLRGMVIKGIIFNQGHNNAGEGECMPVLYAKVMKALIGDWRDVFGDKTLPFGIIAMVSGGSAQTLDNFENSALDGAPWIREGQLSAYKDLKNVAYTASYDQQMNFYHTFNKLELAERIARWAVGKGWKPAMLVSHEVQGSTIVVSFDRAIGLYNQNVQPIEGMSIAGEDQHFYPARSRFYVKGKDKNNRDIIDNTRIVVWNDLVANPKAVRYAWARNPMGNLANDAHMERTIPVPTFRTDDWPVPFGPEYDVEKAVGIAREAKGNVTELRKLADTLTIKRKRQEAELLYKQTRTE
jgi:sialate O-acetylesterase